LIIFLPVIIATTMSFSEQLTVLDGEIGRFFVGGIIAYLVLHLTILNPRPIYLFGRKIIASIFKFSPRAAAVAQLTLPFYTLLTFVLIYLSIAFGLWEGAENYFLLVVG